jgi:hypothetical protein
MQVSRANVFVFVEGKTDQYFYSKVCEAVLSPKGLDFEICLAQELPKTTGGKASLLKFFTFLSRASSLMDDFGGRKRVSIFYLDKDIDDILKKTRTSEHIVYTKYYCLENHFFANGDLVEVLAASACLLIRTVRNGLPNSNDQWRRNAAETWKDWIKLCVFSRKRNINYDCNYGVNSSRINGAPYSTVDPGLYGVRMTQLEQRSGLSARGFKLSFGRVSRDIDELFDEDEFDSVFKGKWYSLFLASDARRIGGMAVAALPDKVLAALQVGIDVRAAWTRHFRNPLAVVIKKRQ